MVVELPLKNQDKVLLITIVLDIGVTIPTLYYLNTNILGFEPTLKAERMKNLDLKIIKTKICKIRLPLLQNTADPWAKSERWKCILEIWNQFVIGPS